MSAPTHIADSARALPVARQWYRRTTPSEAISLITEPHVAHLLRCNMWLVRGRAGYLLVDAGLGLVPLTPALQLDPARAVTLVVTHTHRDHMGAAHEFEHICVHPSEAQDLASGRDDLPLDVSSWPMERVERFEQQGIPCRCGMLQALPSEGYRMSEARLRPAVASRLIEEGDVIDLGDRAFEVLHLPGHSPGSIGLYDRKSGALFSGDAIYDGPLLDDLEGSDRASYCLTMERLLRLRVSIVYGGHGPIVAPARLREIAAGYLRRTGAS